MPRMLFLNTHVRDLPAAMAFFGRLGFTFNPQFTGEDAACMVVNDLACVMLLTEARFAGFTPRAVCDTATHAEALFAFSVESADAVHALVAEAVAAGGRAVGEVVDHGFMVQHAFADLDGHTWEVFWMDPGHLAA